MSMFEEKLDCGLIMRSVHNRTDIAKCASFNAEFNGAYEGRTYQCLNTRHPALRIEDSYLIEDTSDGGVAATVCLIPWELDFEGIRLRAAQLEMVLSHPKYRRQGLMRRLITRFIENVSDSGYDLSVIWGIPYYYRQYGYSYCLYGNTYETLYCDRIPVAVGCTENTYRVRNAEERDISCLTAFYKAASGLTRFHATRDAVYWAYLLKHAKQPVKIVEDSRGGAVSYLICRIPRGGFVQIFESGIMDCGIGLSVLQLLKAGAPDGIQVCGPEEGALAKLAKSFGCVSAQPEQWLMHVTHMAPFIQKLSPVLERRLAESGYPGFCGEVIINLYRQAVRLRFNEGRLLASEDIGFKDASMGADGGDMCIPRDAFVRLLLGFRTLDQLTDAWPDIVVKPEKRSLFNVLFPIVTSHLYLPYHYMGEV